MATFYLKRNDRLSALAATLEDEDGSAVSLSGATVTFSMRNSRTRTVKVSQQSVTVVSATAGTVSYAWGATDTDTEGTYEGEFEATFASGLKQTFPNDSYITVQITSDVA